MRLLFFIDQFYALRGGGAERSLADLMNALCERGHEVTFVVREPGVRADAVPFYALDPRVRRRNLCRWAQGAGPAKGRTQPVLRRLVRLGASLQKRLWAVSLRAMVQESRPDVVIVFLVSNFAYVAKRLRGLEVPLVLCHRNDPAAKLQELRAKRSRKLTGLDQAQGSAARVVVQLERYRQALPESVQPRCVVIPNPCPAVPDHPEDQRHERLILSVGRLVPAKNHALLISAFARLAPSHPDWRVEIFGDGPDRGKLEAMAHAVGVADRLRFMGTVPDIDSAYRRAAIFAFPSLYEGFSRAMSEAMAHGLPVIGLKACAFSAEVISESQSGLLVEDRAESLALALADLIADPALRVSLGQKARGYLRRFDPQVIHDAWERMLSEASHTGPGTGA